MNDYVQQYICGYNSNNEFYCRSHLIRFDYNIQEYISSLLFDFSVFYKNFNVIYNDTFIRIILGHGADYETFLDDFHLIPKVLVFTISFVDSNNMHKEYKFYLEKFQTSGKKILPFSEVE